MRFIRLGLSVLVSVLLLMPAAAAQDTPDDPAGFSITIEKHAVGADGTELFSFQNMTAGEASTITNGDTWTHTVTGSGSYSFMETSPFAWITSGIECEGAANVPEVFEDFDSFVFDIEVDSSDVYCVVTNEQVPIVDVTFIKDAGGDTDTVFNVLLQDDEALIIGDFDISEGAPMTLAGQYLGNADYFFEETELPAGWTMTDLECDGADVIDLELDSTVPFATLRFGDTDVTCTVTNEAAIDESVVTVEVTKTVVDGDGESFEFQFPDASVSLGDGETHSFEVASNSVFSFDEFFPPGWRAIFDCALANDYSVESVTDFAIFTVDVGVEDVQCAVTNTPTTPQTVTITKSAPDADPGEDFAFDVDDGFAFIIEAFDLEDGDSYSFTAPSGTFLDVTELLEFQGEWQLADVTCSPASAVVSWNSGGSAQLVVPDEPVDCEFVNEKAPIIELSLTKLVDGGDGSELFTFESFEVGSFELGHQDTVVIEVAANSLVQVVEYLPAGWLMSDFECTGATDVVSEGEAGSAYFDIEVGTESVSCTVTNSPVPVVEVTFEKVAQFASDADEFWFQLYFGGSELIETIGAGESISIDVTADSYVELIESMTDIWSFGSIECDTAEIDYENAGRLGYGSAGIVVSDVDATCVVTNERLGTVTVTKEVTDDTSFEQFRFDDDTGQTHWLFPGDSAAFVTSTGELTITEASESAWTLESIECDTDVANYQVDVAERQVTVTLPDDAMNIDCTFVNSPVEPSQLTITKASSEAFDGTAGFWIYDQSFSVYERVNVGSSVVVDVSHSGTYTLTEALGGDSQGWTTFAIDCGRADQVVDLDAGSITFDLVPGSEVECTFTNEPPEPANITITKSIGDADDDGSVFEFEAAGQRLSLGAGETGTIQLTSFTNSPGVWISEFDTPGWAGASVDCGGDEGSVFVGNWGAQAFVAVGPGDDVACTFVNEPIPPITLSITKLIDGEDPSGGADVFTIFRNGTEYELVGGETVEIEIDDGPVGIYLSENLGEFNDWAVVAVECVVADSPDPITGYVDANGQFASIGTFYVDPGQHVDCTFTNRAVAPSTLTLTKVLPDGEFTDAVFDFDGDLGPLELLADDAQTFEVGPGYVTLREAIGVGWEFVAFECSGSPESGYYGLSASSVTLYVNIALEADVECTVTNSPVEPATLTVTKRTQGDGPTDTPFEFEIGNEVVVLNAGDSHTVELNPGTIIVTESFGQQSIGWQLEDILCGDADVDFVSASSGLVSLSLASGDDVTCTFVNEWDPYATATITKVVEGEAPAGAQFSFDQSGAPFSLVDGESITFPINPSGWIRELVQAPFVLDSIDCGDASVQSFVDEGYFWYQATPDESIECTFTNRVMEPSTLTVTKVVDGDDPGTPFAFSGPRGDFDLSGGESVEFEVYPGQYPVYERLTQGWTGVVECDAESWYAYPTQPSLAGASVGIAEGANVECTFTNAPPAVSTTLTVTKVVDGDVTEVGAGFNFVVDNQLVEFLNLEATESQTIELGEGWVTIRETIIDGFELTDVTCTGHDEDRVFNFDTGVNLFIELGAAVECVFTNEPLPEPPVVEPGVLTIRKVVADDVSDDSLFAFEWWGNSDNGYFEATAGDEGFIEVFEDQTISVQEQAIPGWKLASVDCGDADMTEFSNFVGSGVSVAMQVGVDVTCEFFNEPVEPASVTIVKETTEASDQEFSFTSSAGPLVLPSGGSVTVDAAIGQFWVYEEPSIGWNLASVTCDGESYDSFFFIQLDLLEGDDVTCTFVNEPAPTGTLILEKIIEGEADGGLATGQVFDFDVAGSLVTVAAGTSQSVEVTPGSVFARELDVAGYQISAIECDDPTWNRSGTGAFVSVVADQTVTCTFTNRPIDAPTVTISKSVVGFDDGSVFSFSTPSGEVSLAAGESVEVPLPIGRHEVRELESEGWALVGIDCDRSVGILQTLFTFGPPTGSAELILVEGDEVACEFTNSLIEQPTTGLLTVTKMVEGPDSGEVFDFNGPYGEAFSLEHGDSYSIEVEAGTAHDIVEAALAPGWEQGTVECLGDAGHSPIELGVAVTVDAGAVAVCTVTNIAPVEPTLVLGDGDGSGDDVDPSEPVGVSVSACADGAGTWQLLDSSGAIVASGALTEGAAGQYTGGVDYVPYYVPGRSIDEAYTLVATVACNGFEQVLEQTIEYIDPEGVVVDCQGNLVAGATVTLYRSDTEAGPFVAVQDGDTAVMDPAVNTSNPITTGADGRFQWFTTEGWYQIEAAASGFTARTAALPVPPEQLGLRLVLSDLNCEADGASGYTYPGPIGIAAAPGEAASVAQPTLTTAPPAPAPALAHTGTEARASATLALLLLGMGCLITGLGRARRSEAADD